MDDTALYEWNCLKQMLHIRLAKTAGRPFCSAFSDEKASPVLLIDAVNPVIAEGQVHGGITQGLGQALREGAAYDEKGQMISGHSWTMRCPSPVSEEAFHVGDIYVSYVMGAWAAGIRGMLSAPLRVMNGRVSLPSHPAAAGVYGVAGEGAGKRIKHVSCGDFHQSVDVFSTIIDMKRYWRPKNHSTGMMEAKEMTDGQSETGSNL